MSRKNKIYTNEFKQEAIKLALSSPSIAGTAKSLGEDYCCMLPLYMNNFMLLFPQI